MSGCLKVALDGVVRTYEHDKILATPDRSVKLEFLTGPFEYAVSKAQEQADVYYWAAMKDKSVGYDNGLDALPHEKWILSERAGKPAEV